MVATLSALTKYVRTLFVWFARMRTPTAHTPNGPHTDGDDLTSLHFLVLSSTNRWIEFKAQQREWNAFAPMFNKKNFSFYFNCRRPSLCAFLLTDSTWHWKFLFPLTFSTCIFVLRDAVYGMYTSHEEQSDQKHSRNSCNRFYSALLRQVEALDSLQSLISCTLHFGANNRSSPLFCYFLFTFWLSWNAVVFFIRNADHKPMFCLRADSFRIKKKQNCWRRPLWWSLSVDSSCCASHIYRSLFCRHFLPD